MPQKKHLYRTTIYLGKELYQDIEKTALFMGTSVATMSKILLKTGYELSKELEKQIKKGEPNNGNK